MWMLSCEQRESVWQRSKKNSSEKKKTEKSFFTYPYAVCNGSKGASWWGGRKFNENIIIIISLLSIEQGSVWHTQTSSSRTNNNLSFHISFPFCFLNSYPYTLCTFFFLILSVIWFSFFLSVQIMKEKSILFVLVNYRTKKSYI